MITECLEAARWAPSACNQQPWRFVIVKDAELRHKICTEGLLPGIPMPWTHKAPVIVALCAKRTLAHFIAPMVSGINYHLIDLGIAGEHFVLQAETLGLGTCWIGWFKAKTVKKLLKLPMGMQPASLFTLGFPDQRTDPGKRLSLEDIAHYDTWK
jgi:nitroreductase